MNFINISKLRIIIKDGMEKGLSGFTWMIKIIVPISFLTLLLDYTGLLESIDFLLEPAMGIMGLPPSAALPLIIGLLTGIYGGIAAMSVLPFTLAHMTLMAVFLLISHSLIQEGIIQSKSGINPFKATMFRLIVSFAMVMILSLFLKTDILITDTNNLPAASDASFLDTIKNWGIETAFLCFKIFVIIMAIMILLEIMKQYDLITPLVRILGPVLRAMGLNERVGILWLTAVLFGVAYGGAAIIEEVKSGNLKPKELERLHLSIGINHSMIEDPALFMSLGLHPFWLLVPRLIAAVIAVRFFMLWNRLSARFGKSEA